eukprot:GHVL01011011.1.p1 GENE.GHVL01011011.1~~GHVL01011011.1.p1  ORF type:complete len:628 (-),score=103.06 GHVL01011011.1:1816-3699(-)
MLRLASSADVNDLSDFNRVHLLGYGAYGDVDLHRHKTTNRQIAVKNLTISESAEGIPTALLREINILQQLKYHPNIVRLESVIWEQPKAYPPATHQKFKLIFDYLEHDLQGEILHRQSKITNSLIPPVFSISEIKNISIQLLEGLKFMHSKGCIHRDLKMSNILLSKDGVIKLADFGLSRRSCDDPLVRTPFTYYVTTAWYRPPELFLHAKRYGTEVDIWSLGCVIGELLVGRCLFQADIELRAFLRMTELLGCPKETEWTALGNELNRWWTLFKRSSATDDSEPQWTNTFKNCSNSSIDFLKQMLCFDPKKRGRAEELLRHPWLSDEPLPCDNSELGTNHDDCHELKFRINRCPPDRTKKSHLDVMYQELMNMELGNTKIFKTVPGMDELLGGYDPNGILPKRSSKRVRTRDIPKPKIGSLELFDVSPERPRYRETPNNIIDALEGNPDWKDRMDLFHQKSSRKSRRRGSYLTLANLPRGCALPTCFDDVGVFGARNNPKRHKRVSSDKNKKYTVAPPQKNITAVPIIRNNGIAPPSKTNAMIGPITKNDTVAPPMKNNTVAPPMKNNTVAPPMKNNTVAPPMKNNTVAPPIKNNTVYSVKTNIANVVPIKERYIRDSVSLVGFYY